jgi:hypothetical protein
MSEKYLPGGVVQFRGKKYLLFRRSKTSGSPFSIRVVRGGKRHLVSTGHGDLTLAKAKAKEILEEIFDGKVEKVKTKGQRVPTVAEIIEAYKAGDRHVRPQTLKEYENCLVRILTDTKGCDKEAAKKLRISELTGDLVRQFQSLRQGKGRGVDYVTAAKVHTGINSAVRQARGLFSRKALTIYERAKLEIPESINSFLRSPFLKELSHRYSDNPIPQEQIEQLNKDLPALKEQDERLWAIHLMIRLMGLRDSEIERARRHWLVQRGEITFLVINRREGEEAPKRSDGEVAVPQVLLDYFASHTADHLIHAKHPTERHDLIYKTHSKWVGARVPGRTKTNHELRKWAGSIVATKTNSWERAAEFLRIDIETAKKHYLAFVKPSKPLSIEDLMG